MFVLPHFQLCCFVKLHVSNQLKEERGGGEAGNTLGAFPFLKTLLKNEAQRYAGGQIRLEFPFQLGFEGKRPERGACIFHF